MAAIDRAWSSPPLSFLSSPSGIAGRERVTQGRGQRNHFCLATCCWLYPSHLTTGCGGYLGNRESVCDRRQRRKREPVPEMISRMCSQVLQRLSAIGYADPKSLVALMPVLAKMTISPNRLDALLGLIRWVINHGPDGIRSHLYRRIWPEHLQQPILIFKIWIEPWIEVTWR